MKETLLCEKFVPVFVGDGNGRIQQLELMLECLWKERHEQPTKILVGKGRLNELAAAVAPAAEYWTISGRVFKYFSSYSGQVIDMIETEFESLNVLFFRQEISETNAKKILNDEVARIESEFKTSLNLLKNTIAKLPL